MKKVLALFLSTSLLLTTFGLTAIAATTVPDSLADKLAIDYYGGDSEAIPFSLNVIESLNGSTQRFSDDNRATFAYGPEELLGATYLQPIYKSTMNSTIFQDNTAKVYFESASNSLLSHLQYICEW